MCFQTTITLSDTTHVIIEGFKKQTLDIGIVLDCMYVNSTRIRASVYRYMSSIYNESNLYSVLFKFYTENDYLSGRGPYNSIYFPPGISGDQYISTNVPSSIVVILIYTNDQIVRELGPYRVSWVEPAKPPSFLIDYVPFIVLAVLSSLAIKYKPLDVAIGLIIYSIFSTVFVPALIGFQSQSLYSSSVIALVLGIVLIFVHIYSREIEF
ncbi:MAG: hypothetical protein QXJ64_03540 [Thermosphaera sp.]